MGCAQSSESSEGTKVSEAIDRELNKARQQSRTELKMLMLGAGESGKSTVVKQMRLCYAATYTTEERIAYREVAFLNVLQSMQAVIGGFEVVGLAIPGEVRSRVEFLVICDEQSIEAGDEQLNPKITRAIQDIWDRPETKQVVHHASSYQLNDSAKYFFENLARIGEADYIPSDQDVLRTRVRSTGIVEEVFQVGKNSLRVCDVGGQRSERKKWIHCFEGVQILNFVAAIRSSEYDQQLWEDESANRLDEALVLFDSIASSRWFERSALILFLNKIDIFRDKLEYSPLSNFYPEYQGGSDFAAGCTFMRNKFVDLDKKATSRAFHVHFTCATDTSQVKIIIRTMMDTIVTRLLTDIGLV